MSNQKRKGKMSIPGRLLTFVMLLIVLAFDGLLIYSRMVPFQYLAVVVLLSLLLVLLIRSLSRRRHFVSALFLSLLSGSVLCYGIMALGQLTGTLSAITGAQTEVTNVCVYVLTEDDAETLNDLTETTFGILATQDRTATDEAIAQLNGELDTEIVTVEYSGLTALVDSLYTQENRAILLNSAYLDVLEEIDGYEDIASRIREVSTLRVVETIESPAAESTASDSVFTVYISGIDSRNGLVAKSRSDVNILAAVNTDTHQVLLISTPRDYYVELSISGGAKDKLTHAGIYGVSVSMDTLSMLYDVDVDYYFRVSFDGFEEIVDALGGVSVYSEYAFQSSYDSSLYFSQGYNDVNGEEALLFARERYAFSSGDRQRGKNQMELIKAIINKALSPEILMTYSSVLAAADGNFETSVPYNLIASLVSTQLSDGGDWDIITYSVDGTGSTAVPWSMSVSAYVMIPDETTVETAKELIQSVLNGEEIVQP
ncbi:MAG: LCP family protein [Lachnospiraceae bacterium]|nr:LCP family protein [Lachnospiraceae bacterium]